MRCVPCPTDLRTDVPVSVIVVNTCITTPDCNSSYQGAGIPKAWAR